MGAPGDVAARPDARVAIVVGTKEKRQRRPVSRVLSPELAPRETVISLGRRLPGASSGHTREPHAGRASPVSGIALLFGLAPGGVCRAGPVTRAAGELLPHRFTLTALASGGLLSVALSRGVAPPGRYPAPCPVEPGLSSRRVAATGDRPAFSGAPMSIPRSTRSARLDGVAGELVHAVVQGVTAV